MNWNTLFSALPVSALLGWLLSVGIPYVSALVTRKPSHLTGVVTAVLSLFDGIVVELVHQNGQYDLRLAVGEAFLAWITATTWHSKVLSGTPVEARLHALLAPKAAA